MPWRSLRGLGLAAAHACGRLPLVCLMWRARFVVGLIALGQGLTAGQSEAVVAGALSAAIVGMSYLVPRWERGWSAHLRAVGDEEVARAGLAPALAAFLLRQSRSAAAFERIHGLELAHASYHPASPSVWSTRH